MFSALRRLTGRGDAPDTGTPRPGHHAMSANLQRKFARGVQYNMKIVIKGDRNVGKTCLFHRLQGKKFIESYTPTEEIQVASIHWNYKATDDIVKVEVWDVVDKGKKKKAFNGLKLDNSQLEIPEEAALDAEFLDVYKGANGVILVMDITKSWTFNYIQRELPKIPEHIPIMILANHCDMAHHRTVTPHHLSFYVENLQRGPDAAQVRSCESSMRNGFGLKILHKFFNLPFLQLQRDTLLKQLETNRNETELTINELDLYMESEDADYNKFLEKLVQKRRVIADSAKPVHLQTSQSSHQLQHPPVPAPSLEPDVKRSVSFGEPYRLGPIGGGHPISSGPQKTAIGVGNPHSKALGPNFILSDVISRSPGDSRIDQLTDNNIRMPLPEAPSKEPGGFISKLFGKSKEATVETSGDVKPVKGENNITNVDEFVPDDGGIDGSFLEDTAQESTVMSNAEPESDSDGEFGNPLVSGFQDDLDPEDQIFDTNPNNSSSNNTLSNNNPSSSIQDISAKFNSLSTTSDPTVPGPLNGERRVSSSSEEPEIENHDNGVQTFDITGEALDTWLGCEGKWRRSPEGGEDSHSECSKAKDDTASLDSMTLNSSLLDVSTYKKEKKKKKDKEVDGKAKKSSKKKSSSSTKEKKKEKEATGAGGGDERRRKKKAGRSEGEESKERDELEEFLNGPSAAAVDTSYEAF